ncbi:MAG: hypothetical protein COT92_01980 [Candidatus Doudnabacteria bacterium CG10_big_fil_rev_8_21_14_0_10_42_18]|uniref:RecF/RecN/SMC N-terminal domain-containing protein n=1 Tax=Candidatus Doudnabacteria bacterium CG10_big_fil_rev_8_21_14_0_10_42_18 TaxID=1974552 RepID=A0A2H0VB05_9BACT|nr:MAG: hypothetical protein COT92_01980 [Candidatus Doudnabacteria bacterium CG10_big_fil_rev_8_21_14_0_10_42_18]
MYLKRLEIYGFKSFAHKTVLEFGRGTVAVVGPNGSGKSNVADAVRWVLGEQSPKLMRGKKSEDVIFAGSDKKTRLGFAEVTATFDNADRRIPLDAPEVSIGRRVDRSGGSEYLINGQQVRLLDIVDLVLKGGINTSRYTVIGQGTIDQMILSGPSEIKGLIDEASGVKTYYIKRNKTLRRLEQTAQNLMRAEDLILEIEPRLKSLRRQAKKMEARSEIEVELKTLQQDFFSGTYWDLRPGIEQLEKNIATLESQKQSLEKQIAEVEEGLSKKEQTSHTENQKYKDLRAKLSELQAQKNKLLEDLSLVRGKMSSHKSSGKGDAKTISIELHQKRTEAGELEVKIQSSKKNREEFEANSKGLQQKLSEMESRLTEMYQALQNSAGFNKDEFTNSLGSLEVQFESFYSTLESAQELETIKNSARGFNAAFKSFISFAKTSFAGSPAGQAAPLQSQLKDILYRKEKLQKDLKTAELETSKTEMSLEFLEKELGREQKEILRLDLELKKAESGSDDEFVSRLMEEEKRIQTEAEKIGSLSAEVEKDIKVFYEAEEAKRADMHDAEGRIRNVQHELDKLKDSLSQLRVEKAKLDTQIEIVKREITGIFGGEVLNLITQRAKQPKHPQEQLQSKILKLKSQLDMIGGIDELTLREYEETERRYDNLSGQILDLKLGMEDLRKILDELDEHIKTKFNESFHKINEKFEFYFRLLFNGGRAYLSIIKEQEQESPSEILEEEKEKEEENSLQHLRPEEKVVQKYEKGANNVVGIDIKATPPGKKLSHIQALSGGERSLTSIALLCSLLTCFPSPFVMLDEVDAALDDANTVRFGQILGKIAHQTQFITVTHNRETMALADILYGVTMGDDGVSKLLSVKLEQAKQFAK